MKLSIFCHAVTVRTAAGEIQAYASSQCKADTSQSSNIVHDSQFDLLLGKMGFGVEMKTWWLLLEPDVSYVLISALDKW